MKTLRVKTDGARDPYAILIEPGLAGKSGVYLSDTILGRNVALVTDTTVSKLYSSQLLKSMNSFASSIHLLEIPAGETSKSLSQIGELAEQLAKRGFERRDVILALGGGVVLDMAGFLAAVYMRGISHVAIPTTLIAQIDVCIGGKTGVNHAGGKNLVGSFHPPERVLVDPEYLTTLHERDIRSGLAELVKTAIIGDEMLFQMLEHRLDAPSEALGTPGDGMILKALEVKRKIVEEDEREKGPRMFLNFGHTVGHALETASDYRLLRHGEAVAVGTLVASVIARNREILSHEALARIFRVLTPLIPGDPWKNLKNDAVMGAMTMDKKKDLGGIPFVLPEGIGSVSLFHDVKQGEILDALDEVKACDTQNFQ